MTSVARYRWLLLASIAAIVLSACGSGGDPRASVVDAAHKTAALRWVRYQVQFSGSHLLPAADHVTGARGAYDFRTENDYAFVALRRRGGGPQELEFFNSAPNSFELSPSPIPAGLLPAGKTSISVQFPGSDPAGASGALAAQVEGMAPLLTLEEIEWGTRAVSSLGTRPIGHAATDEYRVSVDLARAASAASTHGDAAVAAAIEHELDATGSGRLTIDAWVDGPGYIAQIVAATPGSDLGTTELSFLSYSLPYTGGWPPASQLVPLASLKPGRRSVWTVATGS